MKKYSIFLFCILIVLLCNTFIGEEKDEKAILHFWGRASVRIDLDDGRVIYIDPYAYYKGAYEKPADIILVTHQHSDHNKIFLVKEKKSTRIFECPKNIKNGDVVFVDDIEIRAVQAYNSNHRKDQCCGFVIKVGELVIYHSGDTSTTSEMSEMSKYIIDYALLCMDDYYNMGPKEAEKVTVLIKAKYVIPIHTSKSGYYDEKNVNKFNYSGKIKMKPGDSVKLYE